LRAELFLGLLDGRFHGLTETAMVEQLLQQFPRLIERPDEATPETQAATEADPVELNASVPRGVELRVGLGTLLGIDEQPGEIAGWGTTTASVARNVAARQHRAEWRFAIVDEAGRVLFDAITRRRPRGVGAPVQALGGIVELHVPAALLDQPDLVQRHPVWAGVVADLAAQYARQPSIEQDPAARFPGRRLRRRVQVTNQRCIFPGCRRPASKCDQDHRRDHSRGGRTDEENLAPGCRHDHGLKTNRGWRLVRRDECTFAWISPLGRCHVVTIDPIAPPLPPAVPRESAPQPAGLADDVFDLEPSFRPLSRRGRPVLPLPVVAAVESDPDPPPF
jgi:hypothetical protein